MHLSYIRALGFNPVLVYLLSMTDSKKTETTGNQSKSVAKPKSDPKADRLAEALRANLRRRKQAAKKNTDED
ncbi:hypothetical protein PsW64_00044 [Pseudovibrio sp. W64]|uniref:hypothetical protein n=1 Tax=unclassified Pseudovibrio TaxID=2627060 RepID=UPI0007AEB87C|nr:MULTISPECIES: hypothetical protein [unclassified Pseudovibrio]KZK91632.1 hypothetical protein PsAD46_01859 [Pseudovibrio sp. Ad46]KZK91716.1 hypothetical protein PsW64_00044 [Pseudovibrio sp. W64]